MMDVFDAATGCSCHGDLLGRSVQVSTATARIAAAAGVPVVPTSVRWSRDALVVHLGSAIDLRTQTVETATREMLAAFERGIRRDPSSWQKLHRFLQAHPIDGTTGEAPVGGA
jgi:lauroyl/myristoyl acyltransferase